MHRPTTPGLPATRRAVCAGIACVVLATGCEPEPSHRPAVNQSSTPSEANASRVNARAPIEIDLDALDADGLRGPADGKVAVAYEFKIRDTPEARARVRAVDAAVDFLPGSRGRVGAGEGECLCIGSTHRPDFRAVLEALASLPDVERIIECHRE